MGIGILTERQIREMNPKGGKPHAVKMPASERTRFNGSSFDLPLGNRYWIMKGSCRTGQAMKVSDIVRLYARDETGVAFRSSTKFTRGSVYLFKLGCELNLKGTKVQGKATARSSIGRLDVLVRLVTDECSEFDRVIEDYAGPLYAEVTPITFDLILRSP